ncbi:MAG: hypothetical protein ACTSPS_14660, partial [Promethearchaeota archaeon]
MKPRNAIILFLVVLLINIIATISFMFILDKFTILGFVNTATYVAFGILTIGGLSIIGGAAFHKADSGYQEARLRLDSMGRDRFDKAE